MIRWYLDFTCDCGTTYSFDVTEIEVPSAKAAPGVSPEDAPGFAGERDYLYYCHTSQKNKVVTYTFQDLRSVSVPDDTDTGRW